MKREEAINIIAAHRNELRGMAVASLVLFGSVARDEARDDSDVDLLIEFDRPMGIFGFARVQQYLEKILAVKKVDLVMADALIEELKEDILKESVRAA